MGQRAADVQASAAVSEQASAGPLITPVPQRAVFYLALIGLSAALPLTIFMGAKSAIAVLNMAALFSVRSRKGQIHKKVQPIHQTLGK